MPTDIPQRTDPSPPDPKPDREARRAPNTRPARDDGGSFRLLTVAGIPIRVHVFFFLIFIFVFANIGSGPGAGGRFWTGSVFILALFACVVLHELGHALTAMRYGIRTRDIVLYPIGGVASLEKMPPPRDEFWIALAGPAVNVVIAGLLYVILKSVGAPIGGFAMAERPAALPGALMWTNLWLAAFNMLPAFPMDGGRVLRALLARFMDETRATVIAARIGQYVAICFGLLGIFGQNVFLIIIAVFVYIGAGQEASVYRTKSLLSGHRVHEAMMREFHTLTVGSTLKDAADALISGSQHDFPIVFGGRVEGVLSRTALMRGLASVGPDAYVAGVMERDFAWVGPDDPLETLMMRMQETSGGPILVMDGAPDDSGKLVGMISQENLLEFLTLTQIANRQRELNRNGRS